MASVELLYKAFEELEAKHNLIAPQEPWWCCQSCGSYHMQTTYSENGKDGYVFFHEQDAERAAESGTLYLSFWCFGEHKDETHAAEIVASTAVWVIGKYGFTVEWEGVYNKRIMVSGLDDAADYWLVEEEEADWFDEEDDDDADA